ncbi:hypothetical protein [Spiroplasma syrphidicola]|nr:hypothetical protein [Spiroplasma syrphidicola]
MTTRELQTAVLCEVISAWNLNVELQNNQNNIDISNYTTKDHIKVITTQRSYYYLISNNLVSLIGKGKNHKISIYKNEINKEKQDKFYSSNVDNIKKLCDWRNKAFAHIDKDMNKLQRLHDNFIEELILFLIDLFKIKNAKLDKKKAPFCIECKRELKVIKDDEGFENKLVCVEHGVVWLKKIPASFEE